ncbi:FtsX-like permease family protein [Labilibaculum sp. A4]|uniref:ABC transporter permease n=1 Tax=Labilibaculum euxinus TaxID=2686357 RepID=UPI000F6264CC|nr:ABC transporter permease [Labilibaculum euxinus]MDQ1769567.1 ABC transporter permease [Labilibaculum euxinus]MWN75092.1 FtsX-like permease family protein [Labilibaculum euxinus]
MLKILLNTVLRSLYRQKAYSLMNILGLATGVTCTLLILIWVEYETGFDKFHEDIDQVYSVYENQNYADGDVFSVYSTPAPLAESIKRTFPEIKYSTRMVTTWGQLILSADGKSFVEDGGKIVDADFFQIFTFPIVEGEKENPFKEENSIVLTEKLAQKLFGELDPIGRKIEINSKFDYVVSAVIQNPPANSSITFDFILPFQFFGKLWSYDLNDWEANTFHTFIKVEEGVDSDDLAAQLQTYIKDRIKNSNVDLDLQAFVKYHLYAINTNKVGSIWYVRVFLLVAVLILLIACFNYMNLATARSERRAKEVAIRKVVGAQRKGLIGLFLGESIFFTLISLGIAVVLVELLLPVFSDLTDRDLSLGINNIKFLFSVSGIVLLTGIVSGSYPALFLSSFLPIHVIKGISRKDSALLRKVLVVIQFSMSISLFICSGIIYQQLKFLRESDVGYNKSDLIYIEMADDFNSIYPKLKNELTKIQGVYWVTAANQMPVNFTNSTWDVDWPGKIKDSEDILFQLSFVDYDFIETFEMDVIQGRGFSKLHGGDSLKFIINESAAEKMNMVHIIGEPLQIWDYSGEVIGIVKDFNFNSLQVGVEPLIMMRNPAAFKYIAIRIGEDVEPILNKIRTVWDSTVPDIPFTYRFLEEDFKYFYTAESRMSKIFISFTIIAFIISYLGLFGLVSFVTERKSREMALRKVFGANMDTVFQLLLKEFFKWVMLSNFIAWVLSFFVMEWWLKGFAYRIDIGIGIFILSGFVSLLITFLTVYQQIWKLALKTPVRVLKYE